MRDGKTCGTQFSENVISRAVEPSILSPTLAMLDTEIKQYVAEDKLDTG